MLCYEKKCQRCCAIYQLIVVRGNDYNLSGMLYGCWFQKFVTAYNLPLNISQLSDALCLPKWYKGIRLHKTSFSHLVIFSVFVSLWQILSSFYPDNGKKNVIFLNLFRLTS
jgi:hypothetical protein